MLPDRRHDGSRHPGWKPAAALVVLLAAGRAAAEERPPMPGPGYEPAVDVDGDGRATWGDSYAFNSWLELGGSLASALQAASVKRDRLDLSRFFDSRAAALTPGAALLKTGSRPAPDGVAPAGTRAPNGTLAAPFDQGVTQVHVVCSDPRLLAFAAGQAVRSDGSVFIARRVPGPEGGVTRLRGFSVAEGWIPLGAPEAVDAASDLCMAGKLCYDARNDEMILTVSTNGGRSCSQVPAPPSQVKRLRNLDRIPVSVCDEVPPGTIFHPDGIAVFTRDQACDAAAGDVIVADGKPYAGFNDHGTLQLITRNGCAPSAAPQRALKALDRPSGLVIGDFNGAGPFGVYFATSSIVTSGVMDIRRAAPRRLPSECSWDLGTPPAHAMVTGSVDALAFDPFSPSLFATDSSGRIWRIRAAPERPPVLFAAGFDGPAGISLLDTGIMLVSENGQLSAVDGWRFRFKRADANADARVNLEDGIFLQDWLFRGTTELPCWDAADANDDSRINLADAVLIFDFVFGGGRAPPAPGPVDLGADPTGDLFGCGRYDPSGAITW